MIAVTFSRRFRLIAAVGHSLSGERAHARPVQRTIANGLPVPPRANGQNLYRAPEVDAEICDINAGE